ncbi:MAG: Hsp20/alpha crystallin family protein [Pseudomonadota bacterium]
MQKLIRREDSPLGHFGFWNNDFDRLFEGFLAPTQLVEEAGNLVPAMDVAETEHGYVIKAEMPGVRKEDINITLENGVLSIAGESREEKEEKDNGRVIRQERRYGKYVRSLRLGTEVDDKQIKAAYKDGILEITVPKAEAVKPKKIAVDVN